MTEKELVTKNDLRTLFWRYFALQSAFSFERMQTLGWTWTLMPLLKKLYPKTEDFVTALKRHLTFFNTEPTMGSFIVGTVASMEERRAKGEVISDEAINSVKAGLMGPFAGVGDSLIQGTVRFIAAGIGIGFAQQGSIVGPILFFLLFNAVNFGIRWYGLNYSYNMGARLLGDLGSLQFQRLLEGGAIVALMVVGALVGKWLSITTPYAYTLGESTVKLQETLDKVLPKMLPLAFTLLVVYLMRKGWSTLRIMLLLIVVGMVAGYFKILA
jgi:mannose/fructose/sorbose-specific phosphotransferase system IID component